MDVRTFRTICDNIETNINLVQEILKNTDETLLQAPKRVDRAKYFFVAAIQNLLNISNDHIQEKGWRSPINAMDVFIVLGENDLISKSYVPELKRAVTSFSALGQMPHEEALTTMRECIKAIEHCLASYKVLLQTGEF